MNTLLDTKYNSRPLGRVYALPPAMRMHHLRYSAVLVLFVLILPLRVEATNITIEDGNTSSIVNGHLYSEGGTGWYKGSGSVPAPQSEYMEVEPGMQTGHQWDLVALAYDNVTSDLSILSGYNLKDGQSDAAHDNFKLGSLFIDLDGVGSFHPDPNSPFTPTELNGARYQYEIGITFDFAANKYNVYRLAATTVMKNNFYATPSPDYNAASNPVAFDTSTATLIHTGTMIYSTTTSDAAASALAGFPVTQSPYEITLDDMSWLNGQFAPGKNSAFFHITMECGNDDLEGFRSGSFNRVPDGGTTVALLGLSFIGLAMLGRKLSSTF